ncbi:N-acetyltransferase family protein [Acidithiobacillus sp. IBUN Pt1247-S3]|uniref:GNAT family N-acetyltransferase n=1 Tax=Acidithiobacillus sp. IBUN Pt1247-S3 TaxID=3166642 RepID=UPI0034E4B0BF
MDTRLRLATAEDLPEIVAIYNSTIPSRIVTADTEPVSVESRVPWFHAHDPSRRPVWVLEKGTEISAWLSVSDFYGRPAYAATVELAIYVKDGQRGKGHGSILLQHAIDTAPALGVSTLLGFIFAENRASVRLFEKFQFIEWGNLPAIAQLGGETRDLLILGRKLG